MPRHRTRHARRVHNEHGFTLVELLVVVVIIGILASIAIPAFTGQKAKAVDSAAKAQAGNVTRVVESLFVDLGPGSVTGSSDLGTVTILGTPRNVTPTAGVKWAISGEYDGYCIALWSEHPSKYTAATPLLYDSTKREMLLDGQSCVSGNPTTTSVTSGVVYETRMSSPARTVVRDNLGIVATFTDGSRTVTLRGGATRTFSESTTTATITHNTWVRMLPTPFNGTVPTEWLNARLTDTSPDVLAIAMQYVVGSPSVTDSNGLRLSSDANFGPLEADGTRSEGSDFNDYVGVTWTYPDGAVDPAESDQLGSLDGSGFLRMVYGYRSGVPLTLTPNGVGLPRRAVEMLDSAPGVVLIPNSGVKPSNVTSVIAPGDLLFFDANTDDGTAVDFAAMYMGVDSAGAPRFAASRKTVNGPSIGDTGGKSILTGTGLYANSIRGVRRL